MGSQKVKAVFDTNILIDYLNGNKDAQTELGRYENPAVSIISWIELLVGARNQPEEIRLRAFLSRFSLHQLSESVAEEAVSLRRQHKIRLPDAIIWASARKSDSILVTRNTRDFPKKHPGIRVPY